MIELHYDDHLRSESIIYYWFVIPVRTGRTVSCTCMDSRKGQTEAGSSPGRRSANRKKGRSAGGMGIEATFFPFGLGQHSRDINIHAGVCM